MLAKTMNYFYFCLSAYSVPGTVLSIIYYFILLTTWEVDVIIILPILRMQKWRPRHQCLYPEDLMICIIESLRGRPDSVPILTGTGYASLSGQPLFCGKILLEASLGMFCLYSTLWDSLLPLATNFYASGPLLLQEAFPDGTIPRASLPRHRLLSGSPLSPWSGSE